MSLTEEIQHFENMALVPSPYDFDCPICFDRIKATQGIRLKGCLHDICKECITDFVQFSTDVEIRCPFATPLFTCESVLEEREIKALVSKETYERYLARSMRMAEFNTLSFHCQTPDCIGWWFYDGNQNLYKCPACRAVNCIECKAIHEGMECQVYNDMKTMEMKEQTSSSSRYLQSLVQDHGALFCPKCGAVIQKTGGCDGIVCALCKTEICWVTRGPRWGPAGKGDTSGGCRCNVNGKKCHINCTGCH